MSEYRLAFIGIDFWDRPVYKDQKNKLWKEINCGQNNPSFHNATNNEFDGEPEWPMEGEYSIISDYEKVSEDKKFRYQMLDRLRSDCDYFLGYGNRNPKHLWAGNVKEQIDYMKTLWNSFSEEEKPAWLTLEQIMRYEKKCRGRNDKPNSNEAHDDVKRK